MNSRLNRTSNLATQFAATAQKLVEANRIIGRQANQLHTLNEKYQFLNRKSQRQEQTINNFIDLTNEQVAQIDLQHQEIIDLTESNEKTDLFLELACDETNQLKQKLATQQLRNEDMTNRANIILNKLFISEKKVIDLTTQLKENQYESSFFFNSFQEHRTYILEQERQKRQGLFIANVPVNQEQENDYPQQFTPPMNINASDSDDE